MVFYIAPEDIFITNGCMPALSCSDPEATEAGEYSSFPTPTYNGWLTVISKFKNDRLLRFRQIIAELILSA